MLVSDPAQCRQSQEQLRSEVQGLVARDYGAMRNVAFACGTGATAPSSATVSTVRRRIAGRAVRSIAATRGISRPASRRGIDRRGPMKIVMLVSAVLFFSLATAEARGRQPCSGKKGGVSYCMGRYFVCNDGSTSQSKRTSARARTPNRSFIVSTLWTEATKRKSNSIVAGVIELLDDDAIARATDQA